MMVGVMSARSMLRELPLPESQRGRTLMSWPLPVVFGRSGGAKNNTCSGDARRTGISRANQLAIKNGCCWRNAHVMQLLFFVGPMRPEMVERPTLMTMMMDDGRSTAKRPLEEPNKCLSQFIICQLKSVPIRAGSS